MPRRSLGLAPYLPGWLAGSIVGAETTDSVVAFSFDDGPDPVETPRILAVLAAHRARATFFLLARQAERSPETVAAIRAGGHEVGLHGDDHRRLPSASTREVIETIRAGKRRLERLVDEPVQLFRPPFGSQDLRSYVVARCCGMQVVAWTANAQDWLERPVEEQVRTGLKGLAIGGIILLHDRFEPDPRRPQAAPRVDRVRLVDGLLAGIESRGWSATTVGELLEGRRRCRTAWFGMKARKQLAQ